MKSMKYANLIMKLKGKEKEKKTSSANRTRLRNIMMADRRRIWCYHAVFGCLQQIRSLESVVLMNTSLFASFWTRDSLLPLKLVFKDQTKLCYCLKQDLHKNEKTQKMSSHKIFGWTHNKRYTILSSSYVRCWQSLRKRYRNVFYCKHFSSQIIEIY